MVIVCEGRLAMIWEGKQVESWGRVGKEVGGEESWPPPRLDLEAGELVGNCQVRSQVGQQRLKQSSRGNRGEEHRRGLESGGGGWRGVEQVEVERDGEAWRGMGWDVAG